MRLSEAIKLGSLLRPQGFNALFSGNATCALGAADEAAGYKWDGSNVVYRREGVWPWLKDNNWKSCQVAMCRTQCDTTSMISHLNDLHRWTREQIADWVQTIEPAEVGSEAARAVTGDVLQPLGQMTGGVR